ncbi:MAG: DUF4097 domain-containing protein [Tissierellia bacterium]|nr:DUF4097 domain-containing protein [Tissierellia bacterium]
MKKKIAVLSLVLGATLLTACVPVIKVKDEFNPPDTGAFEEKIESFTKDIIGGVMDSSIGDYMNGDGYIIEDNDTNVYTREEDYASKGGNIREIEVENSIGKIDVKSGDVDNVEVKVVKKLKSDKMSEEDAAERFDRVTIVENESNGKYSFKVDFKEDINFNEGLKSFGFNINLEVTIPRTIEDMDVELDVGKISVEDYTGELEVDSEVGNIQLNNVEGYMKVSSEVGNIEGKNLKIKAISKFETSIGNIDLNIAEIEEMEAKIEIGNFNFEYPEEVNFIENSKGEINPKLPTIRLYKTL